MELAIQLYGYLILTFLSIVLPIFLIFLTMFPEGRSKLINQYESERNMYEQNIKAQLTQMLKATEKAIKEPTKENTAKVKQQIKHRKKQLRKSYKTLKKMKKNARAILSYLKPKIQVLWLFGLLLISFLGAILAILNTDTVKLMWLYICVSLICFGLVVVRLWRLLGVITELRKIIDVDKRDREIRAIELLSTLAEKETEIFLKKVYITINGKDIKDDEGEIIMRLNTKKVLAIGIRNNEKKMAKNVEIGFILEPHLIIEKKDYYSTYTDKTRQIVRYYVSQIQGNTYQILKPMIVTPIKEGEHKMNTFIKAENIQSTYQDLKLKVQKIIWEDIVLGSH